MSFAPPRKKKVKRRRYLGRNKQFLGKGESNISVYVRVRPQLEREVEYKKIVGVMENKCLTLDPLKQKNDVFGNKYRNIKKKYVFDRVFYDSSDQDTIFNTTISPLVSGLFDGFSSTVFAYGATGSGKTFTMIGSEDNPGLMYLSLTTIFNKISNMFESDYKYTTKVSYFEIYNENIRDLLNFESNSYLGLRENGAGEVTIIDLKEIVGASLKQIWEMILLGNSERTTEPNSIHEHSSRSHACLQIKVERRPKVRSMREEVQSAKLFLIDLAGSERASKKGRGLRLQEGANINRSLLSLGNCINTLSKLGKRKKRRNTIHVPYRNSKLTRILKDSLSGNCKTVMIGTISPTSISVEETINTLKYATRAKLIKTKYFQNIEVVDNEVKQMGKIINDLKNEIIELKKKNHFALSGGGLGSPSKMSNEDRIFLELKKKYTKNLELRLKLQMDLLEVENVEKKSFICAENFEREMENNGGNQKNVEMASKLKELRREMKVLSDKKGTLLKRMGIEIKNGERLIKNMKNASSYRELISLIEKNHHLEVENFTLKFKQNENEKFLEKQKEIEDLKFKLNMRDEVVKKYERLLKIKFPREDKDVTFPSLLDTYQRIRRERGLISVKMEKHLLKRSIRTRMRRSNVKKKEVFVKLPQLSNGDGESKLEKMRLQKRMMKQKRVSTAVPSPSSQKRLKFPEINGFSMLKQNFLKLKEQKKKRDLLKRGMGYGDKKIFGKQKKRTRMKKKKNVNRSSSKSLLKIIKKNYYKKGSVTRAKVINLDFDSLNKLNMI